MQLVQESIQEIETIMSKIDCPFDFECYKSGFEDLRGTPFDESGKLVDCTDEKAAECTFSVPFGPGFLCACPVRLYIARNYKK